MKPFEHLYFPPVHPDRSKELSVDESRALITAREDLKAVFATEAGKRVLKRLTAVVHPLDHAPIENPILSAHHHGRAEVLAFLWKYSYAAESPNSESEKQTT